MMDQEGSQIISVEDYSKATVAMELEGDASS